MKLTENFSLEEFLVSKHHPELIVGHKVSSQVLQNLFMLCTVVLQPLRDQFGYCVVTSGFRTHELNEAVGGSDTSQHLNGTACDCMFIDLEDQYPVYHELVNENYPGQCFYYLKKGHLHIALPQYGVQPVKKVFGED